MKAIIFFIYVFVFGFTFSQAYKQPLIDCKKITKIQYAYSVNYDIIQKYEKRDTMKNALTQEPYYHAMRDFLDTLIIDIMLEKIPVFDTDGTKMTMPFCSYQDIMSLSYPPHIYTEEDEAKKLNYNWRDTSFTGGASHILDELTGGVYMIKTLRMKHGKIVKVTNYLVIMKNLMYYEKKTRYPSGYNKAWCMIDVRELEKRGYKITVSNKTYSVRDFFKAFMFSKETLYNMKFDSEQVVQNIIGQNVHGGDIVFRDEDALIMPKLLLKKGLCEVLKSAISYTWD